MKSNSRFTQKIYTYFLVQKHKIQFIFGYLSIGAKISLLGIIISCISLFLPWISTLEGVIQTRSTEFISFSSFAGVMGGVGFFIFLILISSLYILLSLKGKQKMYFLFHFHTSSSNFSFWASLLVLVLCIQSYFFIGGLQTFSSALIYGKGIILCFTGSIVFLFGSLLMLRETKVSSTGSYIHESEKIYHIPEYDEKKNNMKLPF